jgi:hypothetical protein
MDFGEFCARRASVVVVLGVVDEVLPGEELFETATNRLCAALAAATPMPYA